MKIIAGLGNPGSKYETTRHNVGFLAVDRLVERWSARGPAQSNQAEVYEAAYGGEKLLLLKPQTFMNVSGRSIAPIATFYKCHPGDLIVIHDDVDLKNLTFRIKTGGGTGGHNGLKSIDECLGSGKNGYHRIRIGVGRPAAPVAGMDTADWVLSQFSDHELSELDPVLDRVGEAIERILKGDIQGAMTEYNRSE